MTWSPIIVKVYLHFGFNSEKRLMPVLQNLYKASFNAPLPPPAKKKGYTSKTLCLPHQLNRFPNWNAQADH